jgi:TP901 family phage tail tape measure protein
MSNVNIGTLRAYLELDTSKWTSRLQQSVSSFAQVGDKIDQIGAKAERAGTVLSVGVTAPIVALGTAATKTFLDFDNAMKGVQAALTPTEAELKQLEAAAIEWGAKTQFSATESAEALGELGKAGFSVQQSIAGLPSVLQLATVAKMGLADAATLTADTLTQFALKVEDAGRVNDVLAKGAQASTVDVQQLGESLKYAGPVASSFGLSIEDTVGALAAFGNSGIKAEMAGTALRNILTDIVTPTKGMKDGLAKLGIETLAAADGTIKLADVVDTLRARGATAADVMTMFGDRAGPVMVSLVQKGSDGIRSLTKQMYEAGGTASKVSDTLMSGLGGALESMKGSLETAGVAVGSLLAPSLKSAAGLVSDLAGFVASTLVPAFNALPQPVQVGIGVLISLTAVGGPAILMFGKLAQAIVTLGGPQVIGLIVGSAPTAARVIRDVGTAAMEAAAEGQLGAFISRLGGVGTAISRLSALLPAGAGLAGLLGFSFGGALAVALDGIEKYGQAVERVTGRLLLFKAANMTATGDAKDFGTAWGIVKAQLDAALKSQGFLTEGQAALNTVVQKGGGFVDEHARKTAELNGRMVEMARSVAAASPPLKEVTLSEQDLNVQSSKLINLSLDVAKANADKTLAAKMYSGVIVTDVIPATKKNIDVHSSLVDELAEARKKLAALTDEDKANIDAGIKLGKTTEEIHAKTKIANDVIDLYKTALQNATKAVKAHNTEVKQTESFQQRMDMSVKHSIDTLNEMWKSLSSDAQDGAKRFDDQIKSMWTQVYQSNQEADATLRSLTMSSLDFQIDATLRRAQAEKDAITSTTELARMAREAIDRDTGASLFKLLRTSDETKASFAALGAALSPMFGPMRQFFGDLADVQIPATTKQTMTWREALSVTAQQFTNLAQASDGALSSVTKSLGTMLNTLDLGLKAGEQFKKGLSAAFAGGSKNWGDITGNILSGLLGGIGSMAQATDTKSTVQNMIGGALSGASIGASVGASIGAAVASNAATGMMYGGYWGAAAGVVFGLFVGYFRGRHARQEMEIVGKEWGQSIDEGFQKALEKMEDDNHLGRVEASLMLMKDFITQAGGLNDLNFNRFLGKLRDVFVSLDAGALSAEQARHILEENFDAFAKHIVESNQLASRGFVEILELNAQSGIYAQNIIDFVGERMNAVGNGIAAMLGPLTEGVSAWHDQLEAAKKQVDDLTADGKAGTEEFAKAQTNLNALTAQQNDLIAKSADELEDMKVIALAAYAKARSEGLSYVEAVNKMGAGIDAINTAQQQLGITETNLAFEELGHFRDRVNQNKTLVSSAEALNEETLALSQIGALNADSLAAVERQGLRTYDKLREAGFTEQEALAMEAEWLQTIAQAHMQLGIPVDENTARLIEQADQYGLLQRNGQSMTSILKDGFTSVTDAINHLIETLGGVPNRVQSISDALRNIPSHIPVDIDLNAPDVPGIWNPDGHDLDQAPGFADGSGGLRNFGRETVAKLHGYEAVLTADQYADLLSARGGGLSAGDIDQIVTAAMAKAASLSRSGGPIVIRNEIGGRVVEEYIVDTVNRGARNGNVRIGKNAIVERVY